MVFNRKILLALLATFPAIFFLFPRTRFESRDKFLYEEDSRKTSRIFNWDVATLSKSEFFRVVMNPIQSGCRVLRRVGGSWFFHSYDGHKVRRKQVTKIHDELRLWESALDKVKRTHYGASGRTLRALVEKHTLKCSMVKISIVQYILINIKA